jgi:hypothetical protein
MITLHKDGKTVEVPADSFIVEKLKVMGWSE